MKRNEKIIDPKRSEEKKEKNRKFLKTCKMRIIMRVYSFFCEHFFVFVFLKCADFFRPYVLSLFA